MRGGALGSSADSVAGEGFPGTARKKCGTANAATITKMHHLIEFNNRATATMNDATALTYAARAVKWVAAAVMRAASEFWSRRRALDCRRFDLVSGVFFITAFAPVVRFASLDFWYSFEHIRFSALVRSYLLISQVRARCNLGGETPRGWLCDVGVSAFVFIRPSMLVRRFSWGCWLKDSFLITK